MTRHGRGRKGTAGTMLLVGERAQVHIHRVEAPLEGEALWNSGLHRFDALMDELRAPLPEGRTLLQLAFYASYAPLDVSAAVQDLAVTLVEDLEEMLDATCEDPELPHALLAFL